MSDEMIPTFDVDPEDIIEPKDFPYEHEDGYVCLTECGNVFFFALPDCSGGDDHRAIVMSREDAIELALALITAAKSPHLKPQTKTPAEEAGEADCS